MADLLTGTYTYSELQNKYGNFKIPAVKVKIDGTEIFTSMGLGLYEMNITLSLKAANCAEIKIMGAYDLVKRSFNSSLKSKVKLGSIVEISIGYASSFLNIFKGFVYMAGAEFGEHNLFVLTCMDVRKLMMASGIRHMMYDAKNYSDVFKTLMSSYSKVCTPKITATRDELEKPVSQITNDYEFIMNELVKKGKTDREFFVLGDKAYFREKPKKGSPIMKMEMNRELMSLKIDAAYLDLEVQVAGYNQYEQKKITGKAKVKSDYAQTSLISKTPALTITDPDADSQEKANNRAKALAETEAAKTQTGNAVCIGLPEIVPGRFIEVVKVEGMVNKKYYISEVRHRIDAGFFMTDFDIGGWA